MALRVEAAIENEPLRGRVGLHRRDLPLGLNPCRSLWGVSKTEAGRVGVNH
jgi:hypothetical protein